ncbi:hypothetical protein TIFTF001_032166 [Ficus carica]|uniref:Uncharacterized protein n=1 Tax=Ficus carica TaxID=3494 RepID=A0AA88DWZ6_FICCA|nr:hypothetical protein TIFTF001_032166 [Ficus carica]
MKKHTRADYNITKQMLLDDGKQGPHDGKNQEDIDGNDRDKFPRVFVVIAHEHGPNRLWGIICSSFRVISNKRSKTSQGVLFSSNTRTSSTRKQPSRTKIVTNSSVINRFGMTIMSLLLKLDNGFNESP